MSAKHLSEYKNRFLIAWLLIACTIIAFIFGITYNNNAVMTLFGKGSIPLRDYTQMSQIIQDYTETYEIIAISVDDETGIEYIEYSLEGGALSFKIEGKDNMITAIYGEIELSKLNISQPLKLYSTIDHALLPLCARRNILAAEIAIIKFVRHINFFNYDEDMTYTTVYDNMDITVKRPLYSALVSFEILLPE